MQRKDITPKKKNSSGLMKKLGIGILGGFIGGCLSFGGFYLAMGSPAATQPSTTTSQGIQDTNGNTQVSNVKLDVNSDITDAVEKVQDAVVSIINLQKSKTNNWDSLFGSNGPNSGQSEEEGDLQTTGEGSGVIYKKEGDFAYIATNNHVVEGQDGLEVMLKDGTKVTAELVGTDAYTDLAVLKIPAENVDTVATFGDSDALKVGEPAIAIGSPLGSQYANSVTQGIISSLNRQVTSQNESGQTVNINAIQTDAAINPGNSGGALINVAGQVIGINSSKIASTAGSTGVSVEGMGFAIPSNDVVSIINQLETEGKVVRPALGVQTIDLSSISAQQQEKILKVPDTVKNGVVLYSVGNATPAEAAGLQQYDVITKIDDNDISNVTELQSNLYKHKIGDVIKVTFYRGGEEKTVDVELSVDTTINQQETQGNSNP